MEYNPGTAERLFPDRYRVWECAIILGSHAGCSACFLVHASHFHMPTYSVMHCQSTLPRLFFHPACRGLSCPTPVPHTCALHLCRDILEENPMMLLTMILKGYRVMQLDDNYGKGGSVNWETGIPQLPEVTAEALKYDIEDCKLFKKQLLGCPKPTEVET